MANKNYFYFEQESSISDFGSLGLEYDSDLWWSGTEQATVQKSQQVPVIVSVSNPQ
jgi:hypothetical protein